MPVKDELGKRMKDYENEYNQKLVKKLPVIIRIDGRAFHTFTKKLNKPFDDLLIDSMQETMRYLCKNIAGCETEWKKAVAGFFFLPPSVESVECFATF